MARVRVAIFEGDLYSSAPYNPEFVEALKGCIPVRQRHWQAEKRLWRIDHSAGDTLDELLRRFYGDYDFVAPGELGLEPGQHRQAGPQAQHRLPAEACRVLHLQPSAPAELVTAAYRVLAKLHHPDRGGDTEAMQRINAAYEALSKVCKPC